MSPSELVTCVFDFWSPQIGDPTIFGWLTVVVYVLTAILVAAVFVQKRGRQRIFWGGVCVLLIALAINKQLDLQSAITAAGRCLSQAQGWYEDRRAFQMIFIISFVSTSVVLGSLMAWAFRRHFSRIWLALIGVTLLLAFVATRAAGFHGFDRFIKFEIANIQMNWLLEVGGISLIALNAILSIRRRRRSRY